MGIHVFSLATLQHVQNGFPAAAFEGLLRRAVSDCLERSGDDRARKVQLTISMVPTPSAAKDGTADGVSLVIDSKCSLPDYRSNTENMGVKGHGAAKGQLWFNDMTDDFRQSSIEDADPETGRVRREPE